MNGRQIFYESGLSTKPRYNFNNDTGSYAPNEESQGAYKKITDLAKITSNYTAKNGETLTGELHPEQLSSEGKFIRKVKLSIADGATVTIKDATIYATSEMYDSGLLGYVYNWDYGAINCYGDATIILEGKNTIHGFYANYPGIHVPAGKTLTIKGSGELTASSKGQAAGIGGGLNVPCGNIVIEDGTINAKGGVQAAGIGGGYNSTCGNITISDLGNKLKATKGLGAKFSIGPGYRGRCGTVTICGEVRAPISESPYSCPRIDLSKLAANYTAQNGETLMGTLGANVKVSIAHGATITLKDVIINSADAAFDKG